MCYAIGGVELCRCGCKGWCTLYPLMLAFAMNLEAAGLNFEHSNPLEQGGDTEDIPRLGFVVAAVGIDGDWPAWAKLVCVRIWCHDTWPCSFCNIKQRRIIFLDNVTSQGGPWVEYTRFEYWEDVQKHQRETQLNQCRMFLVASNICIWIDNCPKRCLIFEAIYLGLHLPKSGHHYH